MFCRDCGKELIETPEIRVNCGTKPLARNNFCPVCGVNTDPQAEICMKCGAGLVEAVAEESSSKSRRAITLLAFFIGIFGAHRFYLRKFRTATLMLILAIFGIAGYSLALAIIAHPTFPISIGIVALVGLISLLAVSIWALVDFILAVSGHMKDKEGRLIKKW